MNITRVKRVLKTLPDENCPAAGNPCAKPDGYPQLAGSGFCPAAVRIETVVWSVESIVVRNSFWPAAVRILI